MNLADTIRTYADNVPVLCLTATAALKVIEDIRIEFNIPDENIVYSMDNSRGELNFEVIQTNKKIDVLIDILAGKIDANQINKDNAFIVFSPTIKNNKFTGRLGVEGIVEQLRKKFQM